MKNSQKGFIVPLLIAIIAVLVIGVGVYFYETKKSPETPIVKEAKLATTTQNINPASSVSSTKNVSVTSPVAGSSYKAGDTIIVRWTPANFSVIEIALIPENMINKDGTNKGVWGGYGGEMENNVVPITSGKYNLVIPKEIPSNNYKIRIISDYSKYTETSYFSDVFTINNSVNQTVSKQSTFSVSPMQGAAPLTVQFTNTIQSAGAESIDYGDRSTQCWTPTYDGQAPCNMLSHTYTQAGTYTAILYRHLPTTELARVVVTVTGIQSTNLTSAQIFQAVSSQLGFNRGQISYFRIFGQDKVQYSFGSGTNFAYKTNGKWYLVGKGNYQDIAQCTDYVSVLEQYNPGCYDTSTKQTKYINSGGQSVNYPLSQMISYIGQ